ncbi:MAG TPA: DUF3341 domain-containing protein [Terriglobia bacterium]|nr:DUF3341 domain-containing protein [Terriglobia bacterium]
MLRRNTSVFGIYPTYESLESAVDALRSSGFRNTDVSFLMAENAGSRDFGHKKSSKAPEGVVAGASSGVVLGGALGWLIGIGALTIPGFGPLLAAGPVVAALAGAGAVGTAGGVIGGLIGIGIPEYEARRYEGRVRDGGNLLSVHCDDDHWTKLAKEILGRTGAKHISSTVQARADFARTKKPPRTAAIDEETMSKKRNV